MWTSQARGGEWKAGYTIYTSHSVSPAQARGSEWKAGYSIYTSHSVSPAQAASAMTHNCAETSHHKLKLVPSQIKLT